LIFHTRQLGSKLPGFPAGTGEIKLWLEVQTVETLLTTYGREVEKNHEKWPTLHTAECWLWNLLRELPPHEDRYTPKATPHAQILADAEHIKALESIWNSLPRIDLLHRPDVTPDRIPSVNELRAIAAALRAFLVPYDKFRIFLGDIADPIFTAVPRLAVQDALTLLEMQFNPRRLSIDSPDRGGMIVSKWPKEVQTALSALKQLVYAVIRRWDLPEVCDGRPIMQGNFGLLNRRDDGTVEESHIVRPLRPYLLEPAEWERLLWIQEALHEALRADGHILDQRGRPASQQANADDERTDSQDTVILRGPGKAPIVLGREKPRLTSARYDVVQSLLWAGENGLTGDELVTKSGRGGAVNVLKKLACSDADWNAIILLPGQPGGRYRLSPKSDGQ
jgi:hypothetical protein